MTELTDGQKEDFIRDSENISFSYREHDRKTGKVVEHLEYKRLRGGRPRKDKDAARVIELKNQGKKLSEIKNQMDQETKEHRSEDAYRKLATSRQHRKKLR